MNMKKSILYIIFTFLLLNVFNICYANFKNKVVKIAIDIQSSEPEIKYGVNQLRNSASFKIKSVRDNPDYVIRTFIDTAQYAPESFKIIIKDKILKIYAGSPVGIMYGLLDIREQGEQGNKKLVEKKVSPAVHFRAIKFNLPWTSYRNGKALDIHKDVCRDLKFWESFLDMMVENRFNALSLWSQHPFPLMVKTEKYPEACGLTDAELADWQQFWNGLFAMAKERGIETYMVNWNIHVSPEFAKFHNVALYCIENEFNTTKTDTSEIIKDYTRETIKTVIDTYPNLTGIGTSLSEAMQGMSPDEKEQWIEDTYLEGMKMASRKIKFIYRSSSSSGQGDKLKIAAERSRKTIEAFSGVSKGAVMAEFKFNWSHGHSTPNLVKVHGGELAEVYYNPKPENYNLVWTIRNEDFFVLRWGQPNFIREHIEKNLHPYVTGYILGSESYIPAKDYITSLPGTSHKYCFERQWMYYKMWGRLQFDPQTPDSFFENEFSQRFPNIGKKLFSAQTKTSRVPLVIASYMNATWDFTLYSEGFATLVSGNLGVIPLKTLARQRPMEPSYVGIMDFLKKGELHIDGKISPVELADSIEHLCNEALAEVSELNEKKIGQNVDLLYEVSDIKAWSYIGLYFANKLRSALEYQKFVTTKDANHHKQSVKWLEEATMNWEQLVATTVKVYNPMPLMHLLGYSSSDTQTKNYSKEFHWKYFLDDVHKELEWLRLE